MGILGEFLIFCLLMRLSGEFLTLLLSVDLPKDHVTEKGHSGHFLLPYMVFPGNAVAVAEGRLFHSSTVAVLFARVQRGRPAH